MRALIEEYGYTVIAVIVAAVMLLVVIFGIVIPRTQKFTKTAIGEDTGDKPASHLAFEEYRKRDNPVITTASSFSISSGELIDFSQLIVDGDIKAVNADGTDISRNIAVKAGDAESKSWLAGKVFGSGNPPAGTYTLVLYVIDRVPASGDKEAVYYGNMTEIPITITVTA